MVCLKKMIMMMKRRKMKMMRIVKKFKLVKMGREK